ncbi:MAG: exopolyphosphatase, partial [bacterium]
MRTAVIDLGTNTCNLLIAEINGKNFRILHQSKQLVKLGDDKIKTNEISTEAINRILDAFEKHQLISAQFCVDEIKVIATSAVRSAVNKNELLAAIREKTGWTAEIISGEKEAELIFNGVLLAFGSFQQPSVILDIGGGSNELILAAGRKMMWKESRPAGMGRVIHRFKISDPVQFDEIKQLQYFFSVQHKAGLKKCKENKVEVLVGCSGAFDTVAD